MSLFRRSTTRPPSQPTPAGRGADRPRILFVDDEEGNLFVAKEMLADEPYTVLTAGDGTTALEVLRQAPVAVLVSDQRMPGMSGVELLQRVAEQWPETIRLLLTGFADLGAVVDAINRAGIWRYLTKPIDATDLQHAMRIAVEQHQIRHAHRVEVADLRGVIRSLEHRVAEQARRIEELERALGRR